MASQAGFQPLQLIFTVRFVQGYRYLDRCGEALVRLEDVLAEGWIPAEPAPTGGALKNDTLGMVATFNSESLSVRQAEFISFDHFRDQACKLYETLWNIFEVKRVRVPTIKVILQKGFDETDTGPASQYLLALGLCTPGPELLALLGGETSALDFTLVTREDLTWDEQPAERRRRLEASVIRQERQAPFDERLLRRAKLLHERQRDAMSALLRLRRQHPEVSPVAINVDLEDSLEAEFSTASFDLPRFAEEAWRWAEAVRDQLPRFEKKG